jgi:hypothetical protein
MAPVPLQHSRPISALAFSADGKTITTVSDAEARIVHWDAASGKQLRQLRLPMVSLQRSAISKDGRLVAVADFGSKVSVWDTVTGKKVAVMAKASRFGLGMSPDGKTVLATTSGGELGLWDTKTGKQRLVLPRSWGSFSEYQVVAFSPDGKLIGAGRPYGSIGVWEVASGKEVRPIQARIFNPRLLAFSPDSSKLAASDGAGPVRFWNLATGKEGPHLTLPLNHTLTIGQFFGADGRTLLTGGVDGSLRLWELTTGLERHRFPGRDVGVACAAFARDGRTLAVAGDDLMALVRDFGPQIRPEGVFLPVAVPREVPGLWEALASADGPRAYGAITALVARPSEAIPFIKEKLKPAVPVKPEVVARHLKDLDNPLYATREKAMLALEYLQDAALADLEKTLQETKSLEVRKRVQVLLTKVKQPSRNPERRQALRAVEVLELAGTRQARQVLRSLAGGAPEAELTREAEAALRRLKGR